MKNLTHMKILIVEDSHSSHSHFNRMLRNAGFVHLFNLTDPHTAVKLVLAEKIDLLVLDIHIPHIGGLEVLRRLVYCFSNDPRAMPPVIVLTSEESNELRQESYHLGARDFLCRTFEQRELMLRLRNQLEFRLLFLDARAREESLTGMVGEQNRQLQHSQFEMAERLAATAEIRDNETGQHITRMSLMSRLLAELAGMSPVYCKQIQVASKLHDLGKIGIPDVILHKPGRLTADEMLVMREHTLIGYNLLSSLTSELMQLAAQIAAAHHEKWDGSGYPAGLSGERIPIGGQICAITDVFDALCSKRYYKEPWSEADATALIERGAGTQFNPILVRLFLDNLPAFQSIRHSRPDVELSAVPEIAAGNSSDTTMTNSDNPNAGSISYPIVSGVVF